MKNIAIGLILVLFTSACSRKTETTPTASTGVSLPQFVFAASDVMTASAKSATNRPDLVAHHRNAVVDVQFSSKATADLRKFTQEHLNQQVQILVGSNVLAVTWIRSVMPDGQFQTAFPTLEEAQAFADTLMKK
jgi:preprotein translocase subunit SecD